MIRTTQPRKPTFATQSDCLDRLSARTRTSLGALCVMLLVAAGCTASYRLVTSIKQLSQVTHFAQPFSKASETSDSCSPLKFFEPAPMNTFKC